MDSGALPYLIFKLCLYGGVVVLWLLAERDARAVREKHEGDPAARALKRAERRSRARATEASRYHHNGR